MLMAKDTNFAVTLQNDIQGKIVTLRDQQVMLDRDLAQLYGVDTKRLNEQVRRNAERFPEKFRFQLTETEVRDLSLRSQIATLKMPVSQRGKHSKYRPYAFTEQGVAMLSAVLKSETAVRVSIQIMDAFVQMRHFIHSNAAVFAEIATLKRDLLTTNIHQRESDNRIDELFTLMDKYKVKETQGIFFQGQIFDAYAKFESFIRAAKKEIVLIDNYVDLSILERLTTKGKSVAVTIVTTAKTKLRTEDIVRFNQQYPNLKVQFSEVIHDRFLIVDNKTLYHLGASLKDLGKKCFAFEILDSDFIPILTANVMPKS